MTTMANGIASSPFQLCKTFSPSSLLNTKPTKTSHNTHFSCFHTRYSNTITTHFNFPTLLRKPQSGPSLLPLKTHPKATNAKMNNFDEDYYDDDDDDDEDEVFVPFERMNEWLENKPRGFGEGKVYDTTLEDTLLEEIERTRKAQAANLDKLKSGDVKSGTKTDDKKQTASEIVASDFRVRLMNLPKKKNVHRDLKSAFEGVPGIINIVPGVSGNKKTRDPICKGFGFVDFASEEHALRFVQIFSGQSITFGKVQKQIKLEMMNTRSSKSLHQQAADISTSSQLTLSDSEENRHHDPDVNELSMDEFDELEEEGSTSEGEDDNENFEFDNELEVDSTNYAEQMTESELDSVPSKPQNKNSRRKKKLVAKQQKAPKLEIPGSAKRLKVKEKSVLTGVLSKYGAKTGIASKGKS